MLGIIAGAMFINGLAKKRGVHRVLPIVGALLVIALSASSGLARAAVSDVLQKDSLISEVQEHYGFELSGDEAVRLLEGVPQGFPAFDKPLMEFGRVMISDDRVSGNDTEVVLTANNGVWVLDLQEA